ncbi:MAG: hypothetical protein ACYC05_03575 [Sulfuricella sp.]
MLAALMVIFAAAAAGGTECHRAGPALSGGRDGRRYPPATGRRGPRPGMGAVPVGAYSDTLIFRLLRLPDGETPLHLPPVRRSPRS